LKRFLALLVVMAVSRAPAAELRSCEMRIDPNWSIADIRAAVNSVAARGLNAIRLETFYHGGTIYPSRVMARWGLPPLRRDFQTRPGALRAAVDEAHRKGIQVHAWVETFYVWNETLGPGNPILTKYPHWSVRNADGTTLPRNGELQYCFISPANLEARRFLRELTVEIAQTGVDGILIDYLRYPVGALGPRNALSFDAASRARAKAELGLDITKVRLDEADPDFKRWTVWRERQTTDFARELARAIAKANPNALVCASVHPYPGADWRKRDTLRDWTQWWPDIKVFSPQYYGDAKDVAAWYARDRAALPEGAELWPNILARDLTDGSPVAGYLRSKGVLGISYWAYNTLPKP
jgi:uncharacterized lipoprotein YddW (UPF0748 family)